ncbi:hypothetical protein F5B22DRAFT_614250, partial [Xylaria bambusicola]|uniref:uncharacterized protein n=1 Tax=Xylaria bambusicola TaxID=326684 RepID=UPI00200742A7
MASQFHIQKPYVLTTLPRPLDPATGAYVVGDVYGLAPALKKRKRRRAELTVGIDGEAINIYDVSSSRLVTSYPIPPQSRFPCPASSIRFKSDSTKDVSRYTYAALSESRTNKVTLFKDSVGESGKTDQVNRSVSLSEGHPVVWLAPLSKPRATNDATNASFNSELLVVRADGEIIGLDGESLQQKWASSALAMLQDLSEDARTDFTIEYCRSVSASEVAKGIFKGNSDVFSLLSDSSQELDDEMEVLVLVSVSGSAGQRSRHLHIVGRLPSTTSLQGNRGIVQLHVMPLGVATGKKGSSRSYRLDARNGALLELQKYTITIHDLTASIPKVASTMQLEGTNSFLPLSKTSLLCSTNTQLSVFNPVYRSLQNTIDIDLVSQGQALNLNEGGSVPCQLVAYFSPLERAVAIVGSNLIAIQLEAPKNRHAKRRAEGLLIDSIGRGLPTTKRSSTSSSKLPPKDSVFSNYLPGSIRGDYWKKWTADQEHADSLLNSNDIPNFEIFLSEKLGIKVETAAVQNEDNTDVSGKPNLVWRFPKSRANYPPVDRRWILFAISRSFQWNNALLEDSKVSRLIFQLPQSNILNYLVDAGHLTLSNLRAAFRGKLGEKEATDSFLAEELVSRLAEIDPTLELLVVYLSATKLGALEILLVLRTLMRSLGLVNDPNKPLPKLLTNGTAEDAEDAISENDTPENENIGMELDDLEDEIQKTVSYLNNEDAGIRGRGISAAFTKLGACPHSSAVKALRSTFKPQEILSLMYVLRIELVKGGWTDRYLEVEYRENEGAPFDAPPDGIIKLIADLLGFCLDSLGPGGWLLNDAMQAGDDAADFVGSLTHEVSAALEGLEEMTFLRNFLAGPVKYCEEVSRKAAAVSAAAPDANAKPIAISIKDPAAKTLPLGLKPASQQVSSHKVGSGGEIVQRSLRERGHLISQKVGSYSLERIV